MGESARALITSVTDRFTEWSPTAEGASAGDGPIGWLGYDDARSRAARRTGESESVVCGGAVLDGVEAVLVTFEFGFLGGSIGEATAARIATAFQRARQRRLPVVSLVATGGSRMQEGMRALTQLHVLAREVAATRAAGLPQIAVLRDPTTGGGWATLGAGADVVLALRGAQVGFAGSRVRPEGDPDAYTAEAHRDTGQVDQLVDPAEVRTTLGRWLRLLTTPAGRAADPPRALGTSTVSPTGWDAVVRARSPQRPRAQRYLDDYFAWREPIRGDRAGGVDDRVECGFGWRDGVTIAYAAQLGTPTRPAGFRTAARLVRTADRLGVPVLTLVDTPGAAADGAAERAGVGPAIAELFEAIASARVPVTSALIGEGGSGGALAFAAPGHLWVAPDSYFSVTSPEAAAAILKRSADEIPVTADELRLRPSDVVQLGIARSVLRH
ncbi:carboxyl transferase domain-containing protein [Saccharomonospora azurea]|uniref:carboxyl transferase domain-containing protein n=1 Tax=Saccharomonospora azurea TaxID=40988 RepID=UPI003D8ABAB3